MFARALALLLLLSASPALGEASHNVFRGRPAIKISEGGLSRTPETVPRNRAIDLECVISQVGASYYWATRENVEMVRVEGGAFVTYFATNGSGYVRATIPELRQLSSLLSPTEQKFDYVEHLLIGLGSVTYYGKRTKVGP